MSEELNFEAVEVAQSETQPTEAAAPKKGRGRPKKEKTETQPTEIKTETKTENISVDDELKKLSGEYTQVNLPTQDEAPKRILVTGYMLLLVCDVIFPTLFSKLLKRFKGVEIEPKKLKLTSEERKGLEPLADEVAKILISDAHPLAVFGIVYGSTMLGKVLHEI